MQGAAPRATQVVRTPCGQCGAQLSYSPGTTALKCPYCGHSQLISPPSEEVKELPFDRFIGQYAGLIAESDPAVHCNSCGAEFRLGGTASAGSCPFCGSNVVVPVKAEEIIPPGAVLPFVLDTRRAKEAFAKWIGSRFWAPNDLKKYALAEGGMRGIYVPYWTYDSQTTTHYTGQRGEYYYVTESYTDSNGNRQTRSVRKTRWYPAAGTVYVGFDDVQVLASTHLPHQFAQKLEYQLGSLRSYESQYLSGFQALRYDVPLDKGFLTAQTLMQPRIDMAIRADIGGDTQMITTKDTDYDQVTFKHVLLPVYAGSYRYRKRSWSFLVNGQTGQIQGESPISPWKVALAVLLALIVVGGIVWLTNDSKGTSSSGSSMQIEFVP